jgi:hypothetical protein
MSLSQISRMSRRRGLHEPILQIRHAPLGFLGAGLRDFGPIRAPSLPALWEGTGEGYLRMTRTHTVIFDQGLIGDVEEALDAVRSDWEQRSQYATSQAIEAAEARLQISEGLVSILRDRAPE